MLFLTISGLDFSSDYWGQFLRFTDTMPITVNYGSGDVIDILMKSFGLLVPEFGFGFHNMQCNVRRNSKLFHFCTQITRLVYV
jgi:hypothetical protein